MKFYFYPSSENEFKKEARNNFVRTIVFDTQKNKIVDSFIRKVKILWKQTCKNNIETDHRIKKLSGSNYQIYSWIVKSENDLGLPSFIEKKLKAT